MTYEYVSDIFGHESGFYVSVEDFQNEVRALNEPDFTSAVERLTMHSDGHWYVDDELVLYVTD